MGYKITLSKKAQETLGVKIVDNKVVRDTSKLVPEVRKEFRKIGPKAARKKVLSNLSKGVSPVEGKGKFQKYSKSYKDFILGKVSFRKINGKVIPFQNEDPILNAATPKKRRSPVNLRFTGQLWNSLKVFTSGGFTDRFRLVFDWRDFLADIHNQRGAGKSKVIRRMLPTEKNENFNKDINDTILAKLRAAASLVAKRFS
jgi:hypothetical protein